MVVTLLLVTPGCTVSDDAPGPRTSSPPAEVTLGLTQLIAEEGSDQVLLRVTNDGADALAVDAVGLDWPGYGAMFTVTNDARVEAGRTLDLRTTLPEPVCTPTSRRASGVLETAAGRVVAPLKDSSQDYLRRLWRTQCEARLVARTLSLEFLGGWSQEGTGDHPSAAGTMIVTRREGDQRLTVRRATGSVLYDLALDETLTLRTGEPSGRVVVRILPGNRCDEHARGQATAPFDFELWLRIDARRVLVPLPVPVAGQNAAQTVLDRACGRVTTAD